MQITLNELVALQNFINNHKDEKVSIQTAYKLNKIRTGITEDVSFFQEKYNEIIREFGDINEEGNIIVPTDKINECNDRINELLATNATVPDVSFNLSDLDGMNFTVDELAPLMPFINE